MATANVLTVVSPPPRVHLPGGGCAIGRAGFWRRATCILSTVSGTNDHVVSTIRRGSRRRSTRVVASSFIRGNPKKRRVVVPEPDYRIPLALLGFSGALGYQSNLLVAAPVGLLGLLLFFQTTRVRFVFDDETLEVKIGDQLTESGENVFVGGKNCWKYSTFVNWEFWWPNFPVLVYFKETQTRPEGQVHFFPIIFNGRQLYDVMVERAGPSMTSGPNDT